MKNWLYRNMGKLCSACLGLAFVHHIGSSSLVLFGEPEFPTAE